MGWQRETEIERIGKMEKEYIIILKIKADLEEIEKYGSVEDMIYETMSEVPFSFDITDCREKERV